MEGGGEEKEDPAVINSSEGTSIGSGDSTNRKLKKLRSKYKVIVLNSKMEESTYKHKRVYPLLKSEHEQNLKALDPNACRYKVGDLST